MKIGGLLLCMCFSLSGFSQTWQQVADFPGNSRDDGTVFVVNQKAYCGLGMNAWFGCNEDFFVFDLVSESWSQGVAMPVSESRQYANGFVHNGSGYVFGGIDCNGNYLSDLWKFNPVNNAWINLSPMPAMGRAGAVSFVMGDTVYIAGGKSAASAALNELWAYDLNNQVWSQKTDLPLDGIWRGMGVAYNGKALVGLGKNNQNGLNTTFYSYDAAQDSWELVSGINLESCTYKGTAQIGKFAYLYGGVDESGNYLNAFIRIDLETLNQDALTDFPFAVRKGGMAFTGNNAFYYTTGVSATGRLNETWRAKSILSLNEILQENQVKVFPNPSTGTVHLNSAQNIEGINVRDLSGKLISSQEYDLNTGLIHLELAKGLYLLEIKGENFVTVEKITVD